MCSYIADFAAVTMRSSARHVEDILALGGEEESSEQRRAVYCTPGIRFVQELNQPDACSLVTRNPAAVSDGAVELSAVQIRLWDNDHSWLASSGGLSSSAASMPWVRLRAAFALGAGCAAAAAYRAAAAVTFSAA